MLERRCAYRIKTDIATTLGTIETILLARIINLSITGVFIQTDEPHRLDSEINFHLRLHACEVPVPVTGRRLGQG